MSVYTPVASPADIAAVQDILKEVFTSDNLESQLYDGTVLLDWVEDITEYTDSDGLKASVPLRTGRTGGIGARGIGKKLQVADRQKIGKASYNYTNQYLQVMVEGPVVARMATNRQACVREIDLEVRNGIEDLQRDWIRQMYSDGTGAVGGALPGNSSSTTIPLGAANAWVLDRGWLYEGQRIDVGTLAAPTGDTGGNRITAVNPSDAAPTIEVENATATTAGRFIFLNGNRDASDGSYELNGFGNLFSDSVSVGGLDPSTKSYWRAVDNDNGGTARALSVDLLLDVIRGLRQGGKYPTNACADLVQEQKYYNLVEGHVRFAGEGAMGAGNTQGLALGKIKTGFHGDPDCPPGRVFMWHDEALAMYSAGPVAWQNQTTGGDILAWVQDYDRFVARAAKYFNVGTDRRKSLGVLRDLAS